MAAKYQNPMDCKNCGARLERDEKNHRLVCPYCDSWFPLEEPVAKVKTETAETHERTVTFQSANTNQAEKKGGNKAVRIIVIVFVVLFLLSMLGEAADDPDYGSYDDTWPTSGLATIIPEPENSECDIYSNGSDSFYAYVANNSSSDFEAYVKECEEAGFTVDEKSDDGSFKAYNDSGYLLNVSHYDSDELLCIELLAPRHFQETEWPTDGFMAKFPAPSSSSIYVEFEQEDYFCAYVSDMNKKAFRAYANKCIQAGFDQDYSRDGDSFFGRNADGDSIHVTYEGNSIMQINGSAASN